MNSIIVPQSVKKAAKGLIDLYGEQLQLIGLYNNQKVYLFVFPEDEDTGFPFIYLHNLSTDKVVEITGPEALDIIGNTK